MKSNKKTSAEKAESKEHKRPQPVEIHNEPIISTALNGANLLLSPAADRIASLAKENCPGFAGGLASLQIKKIPFLLNYAAHYSSESAKGTKDPTIKALFASLVDTGFSEVVAHKAGTKIALFLDMAEYAAPFGRRVLDSMHHNVRNFAPPKTPAELFCQIDSLQQYGDAAEFAGYFVQVGELTTWIKNQLTSENLSTLYRNTLDYGLKALESLEQGIKNRNIAPPNTNVLNSSLYVNFHVLKGIMAMGQVFSKEKYYTTSVTKPSTSALTVTGPNASNQLQVSGPAGRLERSVLPNLTWSRSPNTSADMHLSTPNFDLRNIQVRQYSQAKSNIPPYLITLRQPTTSSISINFSRQDDILFEMKVIIPLVPSFEPITIAFNVTAALINVYNFLEAKNIKDAYKKNKRRNEELNEMEVELNKLIIGFNKLLLDKADPNLVAAKGEQIKEQCVKCSERAERNAEKIDNNKEKSIRKDFKKVSKHDKDSIPIFQKINSDINVQVQAYSIQSKLNEKLNEEDVLKKDIYNKITSVLSNTNDKAVNFENAQVLAKLLSSDAVTEFNAKHQANDQLIQDLISSLSQNNAEAVKQLISYKELHAKSLPELILLIKTTAAQSFLKSDRFASDEAMSFYQQCHKEDQLNPLYLTCLSYAELDKDNWSLAIQNLDQARKLNPDDKLVKEATGFLAFRGYEIGGVIIEVTSLLVTYCSPEVMDEEKPACKVTIACFNLAAVPYVKQHLLLHFCPAKYKSELIDFLINNKLNLNDRFSILNAASCALAVVKPVVPRKYQNYIDLSQFSFDTTYQIKTMIEIAMRKPDLLSSFYFINSISALTSYAERAYRLYRLRNQTNVSHSENIVIVGITSSMIRPISPLGIGLFCYRNPKPVLSIGRAVGSTVVNVGNAIVNYLPSLSSVGTIANYLPSLSNVSTIANYLPSSIRNIGISSLRTLQSSPRVKYVAIRVGVGVGVLVAAREIYHNEYIRLFRREIFKEYYHNKSDRLYRNADILLSENKFLPAIEKYNEAAQHTKDLTSINYRRTYAECMLKREKARSEAKEENGDHAICHEIIKVCAKQLENKTENFSLQEPLYYLSAQCKLELKDPVGAKKDLNHIIERTKYPARAYWLLAVIAGKNIKEAWLPLSKAISSYEKQKTDLEKECEAELIRNEALHVQLSQVKQEIQELKKQKENLEEQIRQIDIVIGGLPERTKLYLNEFIEKFILPPSHFCGIDELKDQYLLMANEKLKELVTDLKMKLPSECKEILTDEELKEAYDVIDQCHHDARQKIRETIGTNRQTPPPEDKTDFFKKPCSRKFYIVTEHNQVPDVKGSIYEINVPGDGSCWLYAPVLAALLPVLNQPTDFKKIFRKFFELEKEKLSDATIEANRLALSHYNGTIEFLKEKNATYEALVNANLRNKLDTYIQANQKQLIPYSSDFKADLKSASDAYMPGGPIQLYALSGMLERHIYIYQEKNGLLEHKDAYKQGSGTEPLRLVFVPAAEGLGHYHYLIEPKWVKQLLPESKNSQEPRQNTGESAHSNPHTFFGIKHNMQQEKTDSLIANLNNELGRQELCERDCSVGVHFMAGQSCNIL